MNLMKHGRKYALTAIFLLIACALMGLSFLLARGGQLTGEWVTLATTFLTMTGACTIGFQGANALITSKTAGLPPPGTG